MAETPNPKYDQQSQYNKHQSGCEDGNCPENEDCGCCPPGLVAVNDSCGNHLGCLTPNDAEHYADSLKTCAEGYVKAYHPITGEFLGCIPTADYISLLTALNPPV